MFSLRTVKVPIEVEEFETYLVARNEGIEGKRSRPKLVEEAFEDLSHEAGLRVGSDGVESVVTLSGKIGRGSVRNVGLREGLGVSVADCSFRERLAVESTPRASWIELGFCLQGTRRIVVDGFPEEVLLGPGQGCLLCAPPRTRGTVEYPAGRRVRTVELRVPPHLLSTLSEDGSERTRPAGLRAAEGAEAASVCRFAAVTHPISDALRQMLECPFEGSLRRLYLEAKALEILALFVAGSRYAEVEPGGGPVLRPDDVERVHAAAEILVESMREPPSLPGLARSVGLNDRKLKAGFRRVLGTTAYGYLHEKRMEHAHRLLSGGEMNVSEVALAVGYRSANKFAIAFRKRFGERPSSLLRRRRSPRI